MIQPNAQLQLPRERRQQLVKLNHRSSESKQRGDLPPCHQNSLVLAGVTHKGGGVGIGVFMNFCEVSHFGEISPGGFMPLRPTQKSAKVPKVPGDTGPKLTIPSDPPSLCSDSLKALVTLAPKSKYLTCVKMHTPTKKRLNARFATLEYYKLYGLNIK